MQKKLTIVIAGSVFPNQYTALGEYLNSSGIADVIFLTTPGHAKNNAEKYDNILSFKPDGKIVGPQSYYYSAKVERSARIARGIMNRLKELEKTRKIDLVISHSLFGAPHFLYDEIDAAIISYIEFPSYEAHGWDERYPPDLSQRVSDRNMEMLHYHQVLKSDMTIVPSQTAKSMFPDELKSRIEVQFEGFNITPDPLPENKEGPFTLGFAARDLSNVKGVDIFVEIVNRLAQEGEDMRFVAIGGEKGTTYGYESQWLERHYKGKLKEGQETPSYLEHWIKQRPAAKVIERPGKLPYDEYAKMLGEVDVFCYPLRLGVANWGLMEILARGGCVIGANHGYVPELVTHGVNGELAPISDIDAWVAAIRRLKFNPEKRLEYSRAALNTGRNYHVSSVAPRYLTIFRKALENYELRKSKKLKATS